MKKEDNIRFVGGYILSAEHSLLTLYCTVYKVSKTEVIRKSINHFIDKTVDNLIEQLIYRYQDKWNTEKKSHEFRSENISQQFDYFKNRVVIELEFMRLEQKLINQIRDRLKE